LAAQAAAVAAAEPDAGLKAKVGVLARLIATAPIDFGSVIQQYPVIVPQPAPKPVDPKDPKEPKDPKN